MYPSLVSLTVRRRVPKLQHLGGGLWMQVTFLAARGAAPHQEDAVRHQPLEPQWWRGAGALSDPTTTTTTIISSCCCHRPLPRRRRRPRLRLLRRRLRGSRSRYRAARTLGGRRGGGGRVTTRAHTSPLGWGSRRLRRRRLLHRLRRRRRLAPWRLEQRDDGHPARAPALGPAQLDEAVVLARLRDLPDAAVTDRAAAAPEPCVPTR
jgi:hypothetical protein